MEIHKSTAVLEGETRFARFRAGSSLPRRRRFFFSGAGFWWGGGGGGGGELYGVGFFFIGLGGGGVGGSPHLFLGWVGRDGGRRYLGRAQAAKRIQLALRIKMV